MFVHKQHAITTKHSKNKFTSPLLKKRWVKLLVLWNYQQAHALLFTRYSLTCRVKVTHFKVKGQSILASPGALDVFYAKNFNVIKALTKYTIQHAVPTFKAFPQHFILFIIHNLKHCQLDREINLAQVLHAQHGYHNASPRQRPANAVMPQIRFYFKIKLSNSVYCI